METVNEVAPGQGYPGWKVGELLVFKGVRWRVTALSPKTGEITIKFEGKEVGIKAMMERQGAIVAP